MLELLSVLMCGGGAPPAPPPPPPPPPPPSPPAPIAQVAPKSREPYKRQKKRGKGLRQFRTRSRAGGPTGLNIG